MENKNFHLVGLAMLVSERERERRRCGVHWSVGFREEKENEEREGGVPWSIRSVGFGEGREREKEKKNIKEKIV